MKRGRRVASLLLFLSLLSNAVLRADVKLPALLADHMVVQRGLPVHVWGMGTPQESISVTFRGETQSTSADQLGRWSLYLSPGEAGGPFPMIRSITSLFSGCPFTSAL